MAIQFILHETSDSKENMNLYVKGMRLVTLLTQWTKSLSKAIAIQRQKHGIIMSERVTTTADPYEFLESKEVEAKLKIAKYNLMHGFDRRDVQLITAYAAAMIVYTNSQRSGVIQNLTKEEYGMRKQVGTKYIIQCTNHKTGPQGRAQLVINQDDFQCILDYKSLVRDNLTPQQGCEKLFLLTCNGSKYKQVYRKIVEAIKANNLHVTKPPPPSEH